jgi:hypothetical protein
MHHQKLTNQARMNRLRSALGCLKKIKKNNKWLDIYMFLSCSIYILYFYPQFRDTKKIQELFINLIWNTYNQYDFQKTADFYN